jgi:hypothetical protein
MSEDQRLSWVSKAADEYHQQLKFEQSQEDRTLRLADRSQKDLEENIASGMDILLNDDELTMQDIIDNREDLNPADRRFYIKALTDGVKAQTIPEVYSDLIIRADGGEDIRREARDKYHARSLTYEAYNTIRTMYNTKFGYGGGGVPLKFKRMESYVATRTKPSELNPTTGSLARIANAKAAAWAWMNDNPQASEADAMKEARLIVRDHTFLDQEEFPIANASPRFMVGEDKLTMDIQATLEETNLKFKAGEIGEKFYIEQLNLIDRWSAFAEEEKIRKAQKQAEGER